MMFHSLKSKIFISYFSLFLLLFTIFAAVFFLGANRVINRHLNYTVAGDYADRKAGIERYGALSPLSGLKGIEVACVFILFLLGCYSIHKITDHFTRPIGTLKKVTANIAGGDLSSRVLVTSNDEVADLASSFNKMADELESAISAYKKEINERRLVAKALEQSKEYTELLFKLVPCAVFSVDMHGRVTEWNETASHITGYSANDIRGKSVELFGFASTLNRASLSEDFQETDILTKTGKRKSVLRSSTFLYDSDSNVVGAVEAFVDNTRSKEIEDALRESEEKYRSFIENIPIGVVRIEPKKEGLIVMANTTFANMFSVESKEKAVGMSVLPFYVDSEDRDVVIKLIRSKEKVIRREIRFRRLTGEVFWGAISLRVIYDANGNEIYHDAIVEDITVRKQAQQALKDYAQKAREAKVLAETRASELEDINRKLADANVKLELAKLEADVANKAKSDFLANVSHEIRTPLNAVLGFSDILSKADLDKQQREYLQVIQSSGDALLGLINDILDISKIEAGEVRIENINFNLFLLAEDVVNMVKPKIKKESVVLDFNYENDMPRFFKGDPTRIRQVLLNLLSNAAKFTQQGSISLKIETIGISDSVHGRLYALKFTVRDTGIGIESTKVDKIFNAFTQADMSTTRKYGGTGLGLSITRKLVKMMNGSIRVESSIGQGASFYVDLPLYAAVSPAAVQGESAKLKTVVLKGLTTAIIDDDPSSRQILIDYVQRNGIEVVFESSLPASQADIDHLRALSPDFVLWGTSGDNKRDISVLKKIKERVDLVFVAISARACPGEAMEFKQAGFSAYITKPVSVDALVLVLRTLVVSAGKEVFVTRHFSEESVFSEAKILLVEDNPINVKLMQTLLKRFGISVETASNGRECIESLQTSKFDLILMDVQMPEMGGIEATRIIRGDLNKSIPIVALTAAAMKHDQDKCLAAGMNDYLTKPIDASLLKKCLLNWLI